MKAALGFLSEYISEDLLKMISESVGVVDYETRKFSALDQLKSPEKKKYFDPEDDDLIVKKAKVETPKKEKSKLEKAKIDTAGMPSLLGFFKKKN